MKKAFAIPFILCVLFFVAHSVHGQNPRIDSLKYALNNCKTDTQKIKIKNELCRFYAYNKPDTALVLIHENFKLARTDDQGGAIATTCMLAGVSFNNLGNRDSAEFYFNRAIQIAHRHKKTSLEAASYMGLGTCYNFWKKQDKALENYLTSYNMYRTLGDSGRVAAVALGLGNVYSDLNNIPKSLEFFNICLHYSEARKDSNYMARCYNNIGNLYLKNKDYEKALKFYTKSIDIKKALHDEHGIANSYLNFGNIYTSTNKIELAKTFYNKAKEGYAKIGDSAEYMNAISYLAECFLREKNPAAALKNLIEAEGICKRNHYSADLASIYGSLTRIYIQINDTANARKSLDNYTVAKDSVLSQDMNRRIAEMTAVLDNDKQKQEVIKKENELAEATKKNRLYFWLLIILSAISATSVLFVIRLKSKNKDHDIEQ